VLDHTHPLVFGVGPPPAAQPLVLSPACRWRTLCLPACPRRQPLEHHSHCTNSPLPAAAALRPPLVNRTLACLGWRRRHLCPSVFVPQGVCVHIALQPRCLCYGGVQPRLSWCVLLWERRAPPHCAGLFSLYTYTAGRQLVCTVWLQLGGRLPPPRAWGDEGMPLSWQAAGSEPHHAAADRCGPPAQGQRVGCHSVGRGRCSGLPVRPCWVGQAPLPGCRYGVQGCIPPHTGLHRIGNTAPVSCVWLAGRQVGLARPAW
jgi:hypothetical protein